MENPNRDTTNEVLRRLKEGSGERFRTELISSIRMLLDDFQMTWDDLAEKLHWKPQDGRVFSLIWGPDMPGTDVKKYIGSGMLDVREINEIAHVFSTEPYLIFRPRKPYTQT